MSKKTLIVFSGDLDRAMAAFVIANGAAAMGDDVTMFFTFWGLNILRRPERIRLPKSRIQKMFGAMMPRGAGRLGLSRMNFGGAGAAMMKKVMRRQNVMSLEELMASAREQGVKYFVYTSTPSVVYNGGDLRNADESVPLTERCPSSYPLTKAIAGHLGYEV